MKLNIAAALRTMKPWGNYIIKINPRLLCNLQLFSYNCRDVLSAVTEDCNLDVSQCRVVLLSQPNELPILSNQASKFAFQSILVTSTPKKKLSLTFQVTVGVCT